MPSLLTGITILMRAPMDASTSMDVSYSHCELCSWQPVVPVFVLWMSLFTNRTEDMMNG